LQHENKTGHRQHQGLHPEVRSGKIHLLCLVRMLVAIQPKKATWIFIVILIRQLKVENEMNMKQVAADKKEGAQNRLLSLCHIHFLAAVMSFCVATSFFTAMSFFATISSRSVGLIEALGGLGGGGGVTSCFAIIQQF
jgi:hypothetical protein